MESNGHRRPHVPVVLGALVVAIGCTPRAPASPHDSGLRDITHADLVVVGDGVVDAFVPRDGGVVDLDRDGLDDREELRLVNDSLPFLSLDGRDACPLNGMLFRARPHPLAPETLIHVVVVLLFERDCGAEPHIGDNEAIGMTIDPRLPPETRIIALRAIAHQATPCEEVTDCGTCLGATECSRAPRFGRLVPLVYYSRDKHGAYLSEMACDGACFFTNDCERGANPLEPLMLNAGEPDAPLTNNLTTSGMITLANGWSAPELFDFDPWSSDEFGTAGIVRDDLIDPAFLTPICP